LMLKKSPKAGFWKIVKRLKRYHLDTTDQIM